MKTRYFRPDDYLFLDKMPITPWNYMIVTQPADGQLIWFRMLYVNVPAQGTYSAATAEITTGTLPPIPWYFITEWKPA